MATHPKMYLNPSVAMRVLQNSERSIRVTEPAKSWPLRRSGEVARAHQQSRALFGTSVRQNNSKNGKGRSAAATHILNDYSG
jgi:hypothetical protein